MPQSGTFVNSKKLFLTLQGTGKAKIKTLAYLVSPKGSLSMSKIVAKPSYCKRGEGKQDGRLFSSGPSIKALTPFRNSEK